MMKIYKYLKQLLSVFILILCYYCGQSQVLNTDKTIALDSSKKTQASISVSIATDQQKKSLVDLFYTGDFTFIKHNNTTTLYSKIDRVTNGGQSIHDVGNFQLKNKRPIIYFKFLTLSNIYKSEGVTFLLAHLKL